MSERAAAEDVAAERFVMVVIEQIRNVGAGCEVSGEPIAAVEIEDAIPWNRSDIYPCQPSERIHPAVPQCAAKAIPRVRHPGAELMDRGVG